jgi:hypothetical protein
MNFCPTVRCYIPEDVTHERIMLDGVLYVAHSSDMKVKESKLKEPAVNTQISTYFLYQ